MRRLALHSAAAVLVAVALAGPPHADANTYGESLAWQFMTPTERAARIAQLDMVEKHRGGVYAAPIYTTNIARQYACSMAATATGNSDAQSAFANSPTLSGASATASGNDTSNSISGGRSGTVSGEQTNAAPVQAGVNGATTAVVNGTARQVLNSTQSNTGSQAASIKGSTACAFGALNG